jgi:hypothetical protein
MGSQVSLDLAASAAPTSVAGMWIPFVGTEAISAGILTPGGLRWNHAAVHPGVYVPRGAEPTLLTRTVATWLWTGRRGVIAGRAAAALHGARWVDDTTPIEVITEHTRPRPGVIVHEERIAPEDVVHVGGLPVTSLARTALDLGRHLPRDAAVAHLDSLAARVVAEHSRQFILHRVREAFTRPGWAPPSARSAGASWNR